MTIEDGKASSVKGCELQEAAAGPAGLLGCVAVEGVRWAAEGALRGDHDARHRNLRRVGAEFEAADGSRGADDALWAGPDQKVIGDVGGENARG